MSDALKLKDFGCQHLSFECRLDKKHFDMPKFTTRLSELLPKTRGLKRLPIFLAIDPINQETDCHLHLSLTQAHQANKLDLELELMPVKKQTPPISEEISIERIHSWLGSSVRTKVAGIGTADLEYDQPPYKSVIPLPRSGIVPIESALIRKSSVSGIEFAVEESDIGLRRIFISKRTSDTIHLAALFRFSYEMNYAMFTHLADCARRIAVLFVLKEGEK